VDDEACEEGEEGGNRSVADEATRPPKKMMNLGDAEALPIFSSAN
jgi:hypothetical protein